MPIRRAPWSPTRRNLRRSTRDGALYTFMLGIGERNIAVFAVAAGLGPIWAGLLGSVPLLLGTAINTATPHAVRRLGSHKPWCVAAAAIQGLAFLPLAVMACLERAPAPLIYLAATIYWASGYAAGSAWSAWIAGIVPRPIRSVHFARKGRLHNITLIAGTLLGYGLISEAAPRGWAFQAFALCFAAAALARLGSAAYLWAHTDPRPMPPAFRLVPLRELVGRYRTGSGGRLLIYMLSVQLAIQVSTPFVDPYLLRVVGLETNYWTFGLLTAAMLVAKAAALPWWGHLAHLHGPRLLLRLGGLAVIPLPLLWMAADTLPEILTVQIASGVAMSAYELGSFLMLFEEIHDGERTSVMSWYWLANGVAVTTGSLVGAGVLGLTTGHPWAWAALFGASVLIRLGTVPLLLRVRRRPDAEPTPETATLLIRSLQGTMDQPLSPTMGSAEHQVSENA